MNLGKKLESSISFFTNQEPIENILNSIKNQVDLHGQATSWKIDLIPLSNALESYNPSASNFKNGNDVYITDQRQYIEDLEHKLTKAHENENHYEKIISRQAKQIINIRDEASTTQNTMQNIYSFKSQEERLRHLNELSVQEKQIQKLKRVLTKLETIIRKIDKIKIPSEDFVIDKENLIVDKLNLLRKLKVTELRLKIRELELKALRERNNTNEWRQIIEKENNISIVDTNEKRKVSTLTSLSILADGLLKSFQQQQQQQQELSLRHDELPPMTSFSKYTPRKILSKPAKITTTLNIATPHYQRPQDNNKKQKVDIPSIKLKYKNQWTPEEEALLIEQFGIYGSNNWDKISKSIPHRSGSECYRRFHEISTLEQQQNNIYMSSSYT